jgi:hypothetical protein
VENLAIEATKSSPYVHFDASAGLLEISGKSYPENAAKFFAPIFSWLNEYLANAEVQLVTVDMELIYFNSSSSKALMNVFEILDEAASSGKHIVVNWLYHEDNDTILEAGEEFKDEVSSLKFNLVETTGV